MGDAVTRTPSEQDVAEARRLARIIRAQPGLTAEELADRMNHTGRWTLLDRPPYCWPRKVRDLANVCRFHLAIPIVAKSKSGYRLPASAADVMAYVEQCRRMGRDYFALAARALGMADLVGEGEGRQQAMDFRAINEADLTDAEFAAMSERMARRIDGREEDSAA